MYSEISTIADCLRLQSKIDTIEEWCFEILSTSTSIKLKDLRIVFDIKSTFESHVEELIASSNRMLIFIIRNCGLFSQINISKILFKDCIRRKLEYVQSFRIHFIHSTEIS